MDGAPGRDDGFRTNKRDVGTSTDTSLVSGERVLGDQLQLLQPHGGATLASAGSFPTGVNSILHLSQVSRVMGGING